MKAICYLPLCTFVKLRLFPCASGCHNCLDIDLHKSRTRLKVLASFCWFRVRKTFASMLTLVHCCNHFCRQNHADWDPFVHDLGDVVPSCWQKSTQLRKILDRTETAARFVMSSHNGIKLQCWPASAVRMTDITATIWEPQVWVSAEKSTGYFNNDMKPP